MEASNGRDSRVEQELIKMMDVDDCKVATSSDLEAASENEARKKTYVEAEKRPSELTQASLIRVGNVSILGLLFLIIVALCGLVNPSIALIVVAGVVCFILFCIIGFTVDGALERLEREEDDR